MLSCVSPVRPKTKNALRTLAERHHVVYAPGSDIGSITVDSEAGYSTFNGIHVPYISILIPVFQHSGLGSDFRLCTSMCLTSRQVSLVRVNNLQIFYYFHLAICMYIRTTSS